MTRKILLSATLLLVITSLFATFRVKQSLSIPPKNTKDVISNSQFSYYAGVGAGVSLGDSTIKISLGNSFPSRTSNNLFIGDTVSIGTGGSQAIYTIKDIGTTGSIMLNTGISAVPVPNSSTVIATRSAIHTVSFEPQVNAMGGFWQFLIKATTTVGESMSDGIPDQNGFDSKFLSATQVTCPWGATASVGTTLGVALGSPAVVSYYHVIQCALGVGITNPAGTGATGTITVGVGTSALINPSPTHAGTAEGYADSFTYIVRHLDSSSTLLDQSVGKIAIVEAVRITATVDPVLTFYIDGLGATDTGSTACGTGTSLSSGSSFTNGDQVVFGSLGIGTSNMLAQRLSCVTNGVGGYVVTAYKDAVMRGIGLTAADGNGTTIPDVTCGGSCTSTTASAWNTSTAKSEFGYTMFSSGVGSSITFANGTYKSFATGYAGAQEIMKKTSVPATTESAFVCYKITATTAQPAGDYEAKVTYTATATF